MNQQQICRCLSCFDFCVGKIGGAQLKEQAVKEDTWKEDVYTKTIVGEHVLLDET